MSGGSHGTRAVGDPVIIDPRWEDLTQCRPVRDDRDRRRRNLPIGDHVDEEPLPIGRDVVHMSCPEGEVTCGSAGHLEQ